MEVREKVEVIQIQKETMESNVTDKYDNGKLRWTGTRMRTKTQFVLYLYSTHKDALSCLK